MIVSLVRAWLLHGVLAGMRARHLTGAAPPWPARIARSVRARCVAAGSLAGYLFAGTPGAPAGAAAGFAASRYLRSRAEAARAGSIDDALPDAFRAIASGLRAGLGLRDSIAGAAGTAPAPLNELLARCVARCEMGDSLDEALDHLGKEAGTARAARAAETLRIGAAAPASLPAMLDEAADAAGQWARLAADHRAATSQARMSALVVAAMPVAFYVLAGPAARPALNLLTSDPAGWVLLALGVGLNIAGYAWMKALAGTRR